jgi:hypothetical protein
VATFNNFLGKFAQKLSLYTRIFLAFDEATPPLARTNNDIHIEHYYAVSASTSTPRCLATSEPRLSPQEKLRACFAGLDRFEKIPFAPCSDGSAELDEESGAPVTLHYKNRFMKNQTTHCGRYICSNRAECFAMELGLTMFLEYTRYRRITQNTAVIVTDSYSLLVALETGPTTVQEGTLRRL